MAKKITIELSDEDHKRFVNAKLDLRMKSLQELMILSTLMYLEPAKNHTPQLHSEDPLDERVTLGVPRREWRRMLDSILDAPVNRLVIAIVTNLLAFGYDADTIQPARGNKAPQRYEDYEARVLTALGQLMSGTPKPEFDIKRFLAELSKSDRESIKLMIENWQEKNPEQTEKFQAQGPQDAPKEERRKGMQVRRKSS